MAKKKMRLRFPNIILLLCGLILIIFLFDFLWRNVISPTVPGDTESIVTADGNFADKSSSEDEEEDEEEETDEDSDDEEEETEPEEGDLMDPMSQTITLSQSQIHSGPLILVSSTCPFIGSTTGFTDFSANANSNVKPRDNSMTINPEMTSPLSELFDAYCAENGYVNLQIYSTSQTYQGGLYTNDLTERSSGYTFDIGLITSTGEIAPYISKKNEWMFDNCWKYGFIVRYNDTKTGTTGVGYMPHHFRYVGLPHALVMRDQDLCLEEYLQMISQHKMDSPLLYSTDSMSYKIFYVPANQSGDTMVTLPKDCTYTVSGNNTDGFIFAVEDRYASAASTTSPDANPYIQTETTETSADSAAGSVSSESQQTSYAYQEGY